MVNENLKLNIHSDLGNGKDLVLLIHGVENSGKFWHPIDKMIAKDKRCISVDLLGFGESTKSPTGLYSLEENVTALENTISETGYTGKITVVGHSMGTFTALEFAIRNKEKIDKIILTSPVLVFDKKTVEYKNLSEMIQNIFLGELHLLRTAYTLIYEAISTSLYSLLRRGVRLLPSVMSIDSMVDKQRSLEQFEMLKDIPITILYGYFDNLVINSNIKYVADRFRNVSAYRYFRFHDIPHKEPAILISNILNYKTK